MSISILLLSSHVEHKLINGLFHNIGMIHALIVIVLLRFEEVKLEQFTHFLNPSGRLDHQHRQKQVHKALRNLLVPEQLACMRMEFEEITAARLDNQATVEWVSVHGRLERRSTECKNEEQNSQ